MGISALFTDEGGLPENAQTEDGRDSERGGQCVWEGEEGAGRKSTRRERGLRPGGASWGP